MSRKVFGAMVSVFLVLAGSYAIAQGTEEGLIDPQAGKNSESTLWTEPGMAVASSDCEGCGQGCYQRCCPRWTAMADFLILERIGGKTQTLVRPLQGATDDPRYLYSNDFHFGFHSGPRVSLIRHGDRCYDLEFLYFGIDGWSRSIDRPYNAGGYVTYFSGEPYPSDGPLLADYASRLYNGEINLRWSPSCRVTMLVGFRWAELRENLIGYERERDITAIIWNPIGQIKTQNDLYGFQIGSDVKLWECGCLSIDGLLKAGIYNNHARQVAESYVVDDSGNSSASTNRTAFIGEIGLQALYQIRPCLAFRAGYQAFWFDGVAVPPAQINDAHGINTAGSVFYHGANAGLEYKF